MLLRYSIALLLTSFFGLNAIAQVVFNSTAQVYQQNFDALANSGNNNNFDLTGWVSNRATYNAGTGANNTGAMYSYGAASSTERALGALTSQTTPLVMFGFQLQNKSGEKFSGISFNYTGEQWRRGARREFSSGVPVPDTLYFEYSKDADSISDDAATWTRVAELSFISPDTTGSDVAKDGDNPALKRTIAATVIVELKDNESMYVRWISPRFSNPVPGGIVGSKDGLAVDDLSVRVQTSTSISNVQQQLAFSVFPNPVKGGLMNITLDKDVNGAGELLLYSLDGRLAYSERITFSSRMSVLLPSSLPAGPYIMSLQQGETVGVSRILISE